LSTTITHLILKRLEKRGAWHIIVCIRKSKRNFSLGVLSWPIILSLGHGTQNMKSSISSARRLEGDPMNLSH
jgi:hypothetical protein